MPNKAWKELNVLDKAIRRARPVGMDQGDLLTIRRIAGFELFNNRPYHNHENWSDGYVVEGQGIKVSKEDLDDAVYAWCAAYREAQEADDDSGK